MEFTVSAVTSVAIANECPICYECISQEKNTSTTDCGHCFHTTCLLKNCSINGFNCPMCRNNMTSKKSMDSANATLENEDEINTEADFIRTMERAFVVASMTEVLINRERAIDRLSMRENPVRPFPNVIRALNINNEQNSMLPTSNDIIRGLPNVIQALNINNEQAEIDDYVENMIEQQNFGMEER